MAGVPTSNRRGGWLRLGVAALVIGTPLASASFLIPTSVSAGAPHVMLIVEENEGYAQIIGSKAAPYINSLAHTYASATNWYGLTDDSLSDYAALISGVTGSYKSPTVVGELAAQGISWKAYMEDMPSACYTGGRVANYTKTHNPFVHFKSITNNPAQCDQMVPFLGSDGSGFAADLDTNTCAGLHVRGAESLR